MREALPIDEALPEILQKLRSTGALVLKAEPGAGKTTRVPPALLDDGMRGQIVVLQPRRVAARSAASRIADERGEVLGEEIGYQVRHESKASLHTRILVCTTGVFLRRLQDDPLLEGIGAVVFDEFHERSIDSDLALALVRQIRRQLRDDLQIVVMSATLDPEPIARFLGGCPAVEVPGRAYPVKVDYLKFPSPEAMTLATANGVMEVKKESPGHILAFLPGVGEIRQTQEILEGKIGSSDVRIMTLYGEMSLAEQQAVLQPSTERKIILSTNVAETSVTIGGVTNVVDSGFARVNRFQPQLGLNRLETERISRASADQRAGRAGRTGPGSCLRLWTERDHLSLRDFDQPEIARVELSAVILQLIEWGESDVNAFEWFETPPAESVERALQLLHLLHALKGGTLTDLGRKLAKLPVQPRLGRLLIEGALLGEAKVAAIYAATLSERRGAPKQIVLKAAAQLDRLIDDIQAPANADRKHALERAVLRAFPDRVCRRRKLGDARAVMVGGRGVRLSDECAHQVEGSELFVAIELTDSGQSESLVREASRIDRQWLDPDHIAVKVEISYDEGKQKLTATERSRYLDLILDERVCPLPSGDYSDVIAAVLRQSGAENFVDDSAKRYFARLQVVREAMPELGWPPDLPLQPWRDDALLSEWCTGCSSLSDLRSDALIACVQARLTRQQMVAIEEEAPEKILLPSGRSAKFEYETGKQPVLAARIQDLFGMQESPRVARGRVPVLMHLLAPNFRVQQITNDLAGFWKNTYPEVKKELKGRYPKHAWPDNPLIPLEPRPQRPK